LVRVGFSEHWVPRKIFGPKRKEVTGTWKNLRRVKSVMTTSVPYKHY